MANLSCCQFHILLFCLLLPLASCANFLATQCGQKYSTNDTQLTAAINQVFAELKGKSSTQQTFTIAANGGNSRTVFGLSQCRMDTKEENCRSCLLSATDSAATTCSYQSQAFVWYDKCFLHIDTANFFRGLTRDAAKFFFGPSLGINETLVKPDMIRLTQMLLELIKLEKNLAAEATMNLKARAGIKAYGMVQCMANVQQEACLNCLTLLANFASDNCLNVACNLLRSNCIMRIEKYPFLEQ